MNTTKTTTISAEEVLNSLNPAHIPALNEFFENKFRAELLADLTKRLGGNVVTASSDDSAATTDEAPTKRGRGRPKKNSEATNEGTKIEAPAKRGRGRPKKNPEATADAPKAQAHGKTASQMIRDHYAKYPEAPVADVIAYLEKKDVSVTKPLVYAVRAKADAANKVAEKAEKAAARAAAKKSGTEKASKKVAKKTSKKAASE